MLLTGRTNNQENGLEAGIYETSNTSVSLCFLAQTLRPSKSHANEVVNEF